VPEWVSSTDGLGRAFWHVSSCADDWEANGICPTLRQRCNEAKKVNGMSELGLASAAALNLAVPRVPKDTSAAGAAIAAKPLLMPASGDHQPYISIWQ
jgi:hypothetical protein